MLAFLKMNDHYIFGCKLGLLITFSDFSASQNFYSKKEINCLEKITTNLFVISEDNGYIEIFDTLKMNWRISKRFSGYFSTYYSYSYELKKTNIV